MKYSKINNTDINASKIVLGTDAFGSTLSEQQSFEMMDIYIDFGGNVLDTASAYANWMCEEKSVSEKTIGKWLASRKCRDKVIIATKGGHPDNDNMRIPRLGREELTEDFTNSLVNLKTDYIDIYWLHRDDENKSVEEIMDTLNSIYKTGAARCFGVSNWKYERIQAANRYCAAKGYPAIVASQIQYSLGVVNKNALMPGIFAMDNQEYKKYCGDSVAMFAFSSQAKGFFSILADAGEAKLSDSMRAEYLNPYNVELTNKIKHLADEKSVPVSSVVTAALICDSKLNTYAQIGTRKTSRLIETMSCSDFTLDQNEIDMLKE